MLDGPLKQCDFYLWTLPETHHIIVHTHCHHHGSCNDVTQSMPLVEHASYLWMCLEVDAMPCAICTPPTRDMYTVSGICHYCTTTTPSLHVTFSSLDEMLSLVAQHACSTPPNTIHEWCCSLQLSTRAGNNSCYIKSSSLDATASLAADNAWTIIWGVTHILMAWTCDKACSTKEKRRVWQLSWANMLCSQIPHHITSLTIITIWPLLSLVNT